MEKLKGGKAAVWFHAKHTMDLKFCSLKQRQDCGG